MFLLSVCLSVSRVTQKKLTNNVNFLEGACKVMDFGRYPDHVTLGLRLPALAEVCTLECFFALQLYHESRNEALSHVTAVNKLCFYKDCILIQKTVTC